MHPERRQHKGPRPKPRWMQLPQVLYAQVVQSYRRRRIVGVTHRVVCGTQLAIEQILADCGWTSNTALSRVRSFIAHAMGGMKRSNMLVHTFRNRREHFADDAIGICAGLWNLVLSY